MEFVSLVEYMHAYARDREIAIVPIPLVADYLDRTTPAVTAMIGSGRLKEIRIGNNRFVSLKSLLDMQEARDRQIDVVKRYLIKQARHGERVVFYEPVMAQVSMKTSIPADRNKIGGILGTISEQTYEEHGVLLSVLVHRKAAGTTTPGPGFFDLASNLGFKWSDDTKFVKEQTDKVLKVYKP